MEKRKTGFAAMPKEKHKLIAAMGGREAHRKGTAYQFTSEVAKVVGRLGGLASSKNKDMMKRIGSKGGKVTAEKRWGKHEDQEPKPLSGRDSEERGRKEVG